MGNKGMGTIRSKSPKPKPPQNNPGEPKQNRLLPIISSASQFIAAGTLGWGFGTMNSSFGFLLWVMGGGALFLCIAILTNEYVRMVLNKLGMSLRLVVMIILCLSITGVALRVTSNKINEHIEQLLNEATFQGQLEPGNLVTPLPLPADAPPDTITLMLGGARVLVHPNLPYLVGIDGKPVLSFFLSADGHMSLNTNIVDKNQKNLLSITDGTFKVESDVKAIPILSNNNNTLSIQDYNGNLIFYISYINTKTIRIYGNFYFKGSLVPLKIIPNGKFHMGE
jgi:hypothetical protein